MVSIHVFALFCMVFVNCARLLQGITRYTKVPRYVPRYIARYYMLLQGITKVVTSYYKVITYKVFQGNIHAINELDVQA